MLKVMTVFGTRPEAIKMCPLVKELEKRNDKIKSIVCVTGQHREMLDQVLDLFNIKPDYDLKLMKSGQTINDITVGVLNGLEGVLENENPDIVLVHGDTTTTFGGSLASFYKKIPVGHVEAGLRSGNIYSPYPEEMNRKLTGSIATLHFSPTINNKQNLLNENINEDNIILTGNTVIDALYNVIEDDYKFENDSINNINFNKKVILLTSHRRENLGKPMENIFNAVKRVVEDNEDVEVIFPMHLNPVIRNLAKSILGDNNRVHLIEPLDYKPFANLMNKVSIIMTDSGGIQEEAPALGKPVIVLRTETERPEAVQAGTVRIAGIEEDDIYNITNTLLTDKEEYDNMAKAVNPYGDGRACNRIVDYILYYFNETDKKPEQFNC